MGVLKTKKKFINEAKNMYSNYDYSKVEYINDSTKVCIICPKHGEFYITPNNLLHGEKCPICAHRSFKYSTTEWIEKARLVHGDKYDYSKVEYVNNHTKVHIICPIHGEFFQAPKHHISGCGCLKCGLKATQNKLASNSKDFIEKSKLVHGNKYDYCKVEYINAITKVCIICPIHGEFWKLPRKHLSGRGCPICKESKLELEVSKLLDDNDIEYEPQKRFKWLGLQSLDFYIPSINLAIECQGEQHFESVEHFGGEDGFKDILERDERKKYLCKENGVKLIYFSNYNYFVENEENFKDKNKLLINVKSI